MIIVNLKWLLFIVFYWHYFCFTIIIVIIFIIDGFLLSLLSSLLSLWLFFHVYYYYFYYMFFVVIIVVFELLLLLLLSLFLLLFFLTIIVIIRIIFVLVIFCHYLYNCFWYSAHTGKWPRWCRKMYVILKIDLPSFRRKLPSHLASTCQILVNHPANFGLYLMVLTGCFLGKTQWFATVLAFHAPVSCFFWLFFFISSIPLTSNLCFILLSSILLASFLLSYILLSSILLCSSFLSSILRSSTILFCLTLPISAISFLHIVGSLISHFPLPGSWVVGTTRY